MSKMMTVVIQIADEEKAKHVTDVLYAAMRSETSGINVTAMSVGDEFQRLELLEDAHNQGRDDLFDDIFGLINPHQAKSIKDLEAY